MLTMSEPRLLSTPVGGIPPVVETKEALSRCIELLRAGTGPVAVDAERASGYRYGNRAYLIQLRREGTGTFLIDPIAFESLADLGAAIADAEWIIHAATQDLPCLAEVGMRPTHLFDTELGGRLAGLERVALGTLTETLLGISLAKEHSAVDWSVRPLPEDWLGYAALDVELLVDLRNAVAELLQKQGKLEWALEEFASLTSFDGPGPRQDAWRRTSGMHTLKNRRSLAVVRELWLKRDEVAQRRDTAPGRILPDTAITAAAQALPKSEEELIKLPYYGGKVAQRFAGRWFGAISRAYAIPDDQLPPMKLKSEGPPPPRTWVDRNPDAYARYSHARYGVTRIAEKNNLPVENLLTPGFLRRICWEPPREATAHHSHEAVAATLRSYGAREWQIALTQDVIADALVKVEPLPVIALVKVTPEMRAAILTGGAFPLAHADDWPQPDTPIAFTLSEFTEHLYVITADGVVIGECGWKQFDQGRVEIGYGLAPSHHGQGFGTAAVRLLIEATFAVAEVQQIWAEVEHGNHRSEALLRRLGFAQDGRIFTRERRGSELRNTSVAK